MFVFDEKYKFNEEWFDPSIPVWEQVFNTPYSHPESIRTTPTNVLEIGAYEGRATVWMCENVLNSKSHQYNYDIVDTFKGSLEESGMKNTSENFKTNPDFIYNNFIHNISFFDHINFSIYRNFSSYQLPMLLQSNKKYDFIYIDASHRSDDTFVDAYFAHRMLKDNGILIFDDYGWKDPNDESLVSSPETGINMFLQYYNSNYSVLFHGYQLGLIKKSTNS